MRVLGAFCTAAALMLGLCTASLASERTTIRFGTGTSYAPFYYLDRTNRSQGFEIDVARALCEHLNMRCEFIPDDWPSLIPGLLSHKFDALVASLSVTDARKKQIAFTVPYYRTAMAFLALSASPITDVSPQAMKGRKIGAQIGTNAARYLDDRYEGAGVEIRLYPTQDEAYLDLQSGDIDAVLGDKVGFMAWMQKHASKTCCRFVGEDVTDRNYVGDGIAFAVRKEDNTLRSDLNRAIGDILADGTYKRINDKYFPFSVY